MNKGIFIVALLLWGFSGLQAQSSKADAIIGVYYTPDKGGKIELYKRNGKYYGKSTCCNATRKDVKNPNPKLRTRSRIGMEFINNFVFDGDELYEQGTVYNPDDGRTYTARMWLEGKVLHMRGYIGSPILGKTVTFERVE